MQVLITEVWLTVYFLSVPKKKNYLLMKYILWSIFFNQTNRDIVRRKLAIFLQCVAHTLGNYYNCDPSLSLVQVQQHGVRRGEAGWRDGRRAAAGQESPVLIGECVPRHSPRSPTVRASSLPRKWVHSAIFPIFLYLSVAKIYMKLFSISQFYYFRSICGTTFYFYYSSNITLYYSPSFSFLIFPVNMLSDWRVFDKY